MRRTLLLLAMLLHVIAAQAQLTLSSITDSTYCPNVGVAVTYSDPVTTYLPGNIFKIQRSDSTGSFAAPYDLTIFGTTSSNGTRNIAPLNGITSSTGYRIRIISTNPVQVSPEITFDLIELPLPVVSLSASATSVCLGGSVTLQASGGSSYSWSVYQPFSGSWPISLTPFQADSTLNISPENNGQYIVRAMGANGCINSASIPINTFLASLVTMPADTFCPGEPVTISASGFCTYRWTGPATWSSSATTAEITVNYFNSDATFIAIGTDETGCEHHVQFPLVIAPLAPAVNLDNSNPYLCPGQSTTLSASGLSAYTWQPGNIAGSSVTVSPAATTTYTLTGVQANGCPVNWPTSVSVLPAVASPVSYHSCAGGAGGINLNAKYYSPTAIYSWTGPNGFVANQWNVANNLSEPGTYSVSIFESACNQTITGSVTVQPGQQPEPPYPPIGYFSPTLCPGQPLQLTVGAIVPGGVYSWTGPNGFSSNLPNPLVLNPVPASMGFYGVTVTVNGCTSLPWHTSAYFTSAPEVTLSAAQTSIQPGQTTTLSASGPCLSYSWAPVATLSSDSGAVVTASPSITTTYTLYSTNSKTGCTAIDTITIYTGVVGLEDELNQNGIQIFPNPTSGVLHVKLTTAETGNCQIRLVNLLGQVMREEESISETSQFEKTLDLSDLQTGIYLLHVRHGNASYTKRVVLQR